MNDEKLMAVAESLDALSRSIKEMCNGTKEEDPKAEAKPKEEPKDQETKYTLDDVRKMLADKAVSGHREEVRQLLLKHGASQLSSIAESEYAAIMEEAKEME